jgi:hypothetical protein
MALLCQKCTESGTGPYGYTIAPDINYGKKVYFGDTGALENYTGTIWEKAGQTTSRDITMSGVVVKQIDVTIPETGRVSVTPTFWGLKYDNDADGSGGTFTLPTVATEVMARDLEFKFGPTPVALYSKEISFSLVADIQVRRYGGLNDEFPYAFIYNGWSLENGSFTQPILAGSDTISEDYFVGGGDTALDTRLFIYSKSMATYDEAIASMANGEMRFSFNIKVDQAIPSGDDELVEAISFKGLDDLGYDIFKYELVTTAQQSWGS